MPDPSQNILITFEADPSGLAPGVEGLEQLGQVDKQTADAFTKTNDQLKQRQKIVQDSSSSLSAYVQDLLKVQKGTTAAFTLKGITDFQKAVSKTSSETKILQATIALAKQNLDKFKPDTQDWQNLNKLIEQGDQLITQLGDSEDKASEKTVSLKTQLRQMKEELATIDDPSNPRFIQLATQAAKLEDKMNDTREQVRLLSSDTSHLDATIQAVSGLAGAFAVAQGAAALLGDEGKDLQLALLKVNAAMSILQGLQQVQALLDKNSALNIFLIKNLRLQDAAATAAQTEAIGAETVATEGATVAQEELNTAMSLNPAAILILTLTTLVSIMYAFSTSTNEAAEAQEKLNLELENNKRVSDDLQSTLSRQDKERLAELRAQGASEKELRDEELKLSQDRFNIRKNDLQDAVDAGRKANNELKTLAQNNFEVEKHYNEVTMDGTVHDRIKRVKVEQDYIDNLVKTRDEGISAQKEFNDTQSELRIQDLDNLTATNKEIADANAKALADQKEHDAKVLAERRAQDQALLQLNENGLSFQAEQAKRIADDQDLSSGIRITALKQYLQLQIQAIQQAADDEIYINHLTGAQALVVRQKAAQDIIRVTQTTEDSISGIRKKSEQETNDAILKQREDFENSIIAMGDAATAHLQKNREADAAAAQAATSKRQAIAQAEYGLLSQLSSGFFQSQSQYYQNELQQVQELADQKQITEQEAAKRTAQIRKQQAASAKEEALFNIAISVAQAISRDLVGNKFLIPFDIATGIAETALVLARPLPKYKHGKVRIDGPGNETSDSIFAMLSKNESVINAEATKRYEPALKAINDLRFEEFLFKQKMFDLPVMKDIPASALQSVQSEIDYDKLGEAFAKHVGKISEIPQSGLSFDENGVRHWIRKDNQLLIYLNKRFGYKP